MCILHFLQSLYSNNPTLTPPFPSLYVVQICDMVAIARYLNVTLIVPELDKTSFWADPRCVIFHSFSFISGWTKLHMVELQKP